MINTNSSRRVATLAFAITTLCLSSIASAAPILLEFEGTISGGIDIRFTSLVSAGDAVSGSMALDFNPPGIGNVASATGSYAVPSGSVSGIGYGGGFFTPTLGSMEFFGGTGPGVSIAPDTFSLSGIFFVFNIDGANAILNDYLALSAADLSSAGLFGLFDLVGPDVIAPVADVRMSSISFSVASVPEPGIFGLMSLGLLGLLINRAR